LEAGRDAPAFIEVTSAPELARAAHHTTGSMFEVVVGAGRVVRVPSDFDERALRRLLAVVEERSC